MVSQNFVWLFLLSFLTGGISRYSIVASAFVPLRSTTSGIEQQQQRRLGRCFLDPAFVEKETETPEQQFDKTGQEFTIGKTVRVSKEGLKAHQVPPKGKGSFDGKKFVPDESLAYLILPVGLQGVVDKVIDTQAISANFPIRVKFAPKEDAADDDDDALSPPVAFLMHFLPTELEVVS